MSNQEQKPDTCGCCEGVKALTPVQIKNLPGLSALAYRVGTHASFKITMQSALSGQPRLRKLTTRDDDDPAIALCDAWATVLDVLSFYQERIANEGYLRTATERRSILEMARSIGYELRPGVAAGTYLAFTLETAKGSPTTAKIGVGTKAQSVPAQDESAQVFETVEEIEARVERNALQPRHKMPQEISLGTTKLYLKGTNTGLQPGDTILLVGDTRDHDPFSERWDFRILQTVVPNAQRNHTLVTWKEALGHYTSKYQKDKDRKKPKPTVEPADNPRIYAFRQRAALFGHNAPDWRVMSDEIKESYEPDYKKDKRKWQWPDFEAKEDRRIYLDAAYPKILEDSWIVLMKPGYAELYKAVNVATESRTDFTLNSKTTLIDTDTGLHLNWFPRRDTVVFAQSEQLDLAERPLSIPVFGNRIILGQAVEGLEQGHTLIVSGKRLRYLRVAERTRVIRVDWKEITREEKLLLDPADDSESVTLMTGDLLEVVGAPVLTSEGLIMWHLRDKDGISGFVTAEPDDFIPEPAPEKHDMVDRPELTTEDEQIVSEVVKLDRTEKVGDFTRLVFTSQLQNAYQRDSVTINGNIARATHGETKKEVLGSGDGSQTCQKLELKQKPLTYTSAATSSGTKSTLEVRVNDLLWEEVSTLNGVPPEKRVYITRIADDGKVTVQFGDGINGARLPTGVENIVATYRVGTSLDGMLKAGQISTLMTRPLGVREVSNPLPSTGADNPEKLDRARRNAPLTVLTFDRIVSLSDFEDFANAFAGIGKAQATIMWDGEQPLVHITVAGADGGPIAPTSDLYWNLIDGIDAARHPDHRVKVDSYKRLTFNVKAKVRVDGSYIVEDVLALVKAALKNAFSFEKRWFGQAVTPSEVLAVMQRVQGVIAVDLEELGGKDPFEEEHFRLPADIDQLLTINPDGIVLTEMTI